MALSYTEKGRDLCELLENIAEVITYCSWIYLHKSSCWPHTSVTALCTCVCMLVCLLACGHYAINFKLTRLNITKIELGG